MPVEITSYSYDELPEWMWERLRAGEADVRIGGRAGSTEEFLAAARRAHAAELAAELNADEDDGPAEGYQARP